MWTIATYQPTSLFSLRPTLSTASGGQTLVLPSPFAVKMALLDVAIRGWGLAQGKAWWEAIRDLQVAVALPPQLLVNNTFIKIQRLRKNGPKDTQGNGIEGALGPTIAFRAFVYFQGPLEIALAFGEAAPQVARKGRGKAKATLPSDPAEPPPLAALLAQINYLGKRGSFMQLQAAPRQTEELVEQDNGSFVKLNGPPSTDFLLEGLMQMVDDCASHLEFAHVNIYDPKILQVGKDRVARPVVLPYRLARSSQRYQLYQRIESTER